MKWIILAGLTLSTVSAVSTTPHQPPPPTSLPPVVATYKIPATLYNLRVGHVVEPIYETTMWRGSELVMYVRPGSTYRVERIDNGGWLYTTVNTGVSYVSGWIAIRDVYILQ